MSSRLDPGTSPPEGGSGGGAKNEVRIGSVGPLDRWARSLGPRSEALSLTRAAGERKGEDSLGLQEGGSKRKNVLKRWNKGKPCSRLKGSDFELETRELNNSEQIQTRLTANYPWGPTQFSRTSQ